MIGRDRRKLGVGAVSGMDREGFHVADLLGFHLTGISFGID